MTPTNKGFINSLWNFFCSLKLTISLLIGLAAASSIGTVVPQNAPLMQYQKLYSDTTIRVFDNLNFFNMYHSWWFILLLYLLTLNLVACSLKRLPRDWKIFTKPTLVLDENMEKSMSLVRHLKMTGSPEKIRENMERFLRREFAAPVVTEGDGKVWLFAQKDIVSRLGVYVLHFSIIIIFIGALVGSYFGYKAFVNIPEGGQTSTAYKRPPAGSMETPELLSQLAIELGFTVRCESFSVSYYDNGAPKEFKSVLTIVDKGNTIIDKRPVIVNSPLTYKGITFYQSSFSPAGDPVFHLSARDRKSGVEKKITARQGQKITLADGSSLQILEYTEDISPFVPRVSGPAVRVETTPKSGDSQFFLLLKNYPDLDVQRGGDLIFTYDSIDQKWMTGLQVTKDPGVWLVWLGCFMLIVGTFIAFFMSHKRIWVRIEGGRVSIAGAASKNQAVFQQSFERLVEKLKAV